MYLTTWIVDRIVQLFQPWGPLQMIFFMASIVVVFVLLPFQLIRWFLAGAPSKPTLSDGDKRFIRISIMMIFILGFIGSAVLSWGTEGRLLDRGDFGSLTFKLSFYVYLALMIALAWILRNKEWLRRAMVGYGLALLFFVPSFGNNLGIALNQRLDTGPSAAHDARVIDKFKVHVSGRYARTYYYASILSWRPGHYLESLLVSPSDYNLLQPKQSYVQVETKPGWLGYPWIRAYNLKSQ